MGIGSPLPRPLLVADGRQRGVVLGLAQPALVDAPKLSRAHARDDNANPAPRGR
jgi:hypothetical protein